MNEFLFILAKTKYKQTNKPQERTTKLKEKKSF